MTVARTGLKVNVMGHYGNAVGPTSIEGRFFHLLTLSPPVMVTKLVRDSRWS